MIKVTFSNQNDNKIAEFFFEWVKFYGGDLVIPEDSAGRLGVGGLADSQDYAPNTLASTAQSGTWFLRTHVDFFDDVDLRNQGPIFVDLESWFALVENQTGQVYEKRTNVYMGKVWIDETGAWNIKTEIDVGYFPINKLLPHLGYEKEEPKGEK